jgi:tripartite-type tricarboxylate transporter receptor subunit TctC
MPGPTRRGAAATTALAVLPVLGARCPAAAQGAAQGVAAAPWPTRPVTMIVTYAAGGSADTLARLIGPVLAEALGQPVVIENRPGGGGTVGSTAVARAAPDGYTIQIGAVSTHAIAKQLFGARLPYDPQGSFTPIGQILRQPNLLLLGNHIPPRTVVEFVAWGKGQRSVLYGTAGVGSSPHLVGAMIGDVYGIRMEMVPYRGSGQALADLLAGQVHAVVDNIVTAAPLAQDGRAKAAAVSSIERSSMMPQVPSFAESGAPGFDLVSWQALYGPARLPEPITHRLSDALRQVVGDPAVRRRLVETGCEPAFSTPEQLAALMAEEIPKWSRLVQISGATAD